MKKIDMNKMSKDLIFGTDLSAKLNPDELQELIDKAANKAQITAQNIANQFRKRPEVLIERTHKELSELKTLVRKGVKKGKDIGFSLMALNSLLPHGSWNDFLKQLGMSRQSAHVYMQLAKHWEFIEPAIANMEEDQISTRECLRYVAEVKQFIVDSAAEELASELKLIQKPEPIKTTKAKRQSHDLDAMCAKARAAVGALLTYVGAPIVDRTLVEIRASISGALPEDDIE